MLTLNVSCTKRRDDTAVAENETLNIALECVYLLYLSINKLKATRCTSLHFLKVTKYITSYIAIIFLPSMYVCVCNRNNIFSINMLRKIVTEITTTCFNVLKLCTRIYVIYICQHLNNVGMFISYKPYSNYCFLNRTFILYYQRV